VGKATVFVKVFPGICHFQHNHIFTPPRRICDYTVCQYHPGRKGKLLVLCNIYSVAEFFEADPLQTVI
jgi:hypothetical protein